MVEEAVEERGDGGGVAEQLAPVVDGPVGGEDRRGAFGAAHDPFEQILGGRGRRLAHVEIVDDAQGHGAQHGEDPLARALEGGVGQLLEEPMRFAIAHAVPLLDRRLAEGLGQVALAGAPRLPFKPPGSRFPAR